MIQNKASVETIIRDYIEHKEKSVLFGKKKLDAEKEYNKLLTSYNGEAKQYSLDQADRIFKAYLSMADNAEQAANAQIKFSEAEESLKEVGRILFDATIIAEIDLSSINNETPAKKRVRVDYHNGEVVVS